MSRNYNVLTARLPAAVLASALAVPALAACSKEMPDSDTSKTAPPATSETSLPSTIKKMHTARSLGIILFAASQEAGGSHDIYEMDLHTGRVSNLTNSDADELNPQVSPDGTKAVYAGANKKGNYQIFSINLGTRRITQLTDDTANNFDPTYTPDGHILYKSNAKDGYGDIWKMDAQGANRRDLTPNMNHTEEWKPTAVGDNLVVFTSRHADDGSMSKAQLAATDELMLLDTSEQDAEPTPLTENLWPDWYSEANPAHPGTIAYTSKENAGGPDTIYEMDVTQADANAHRVRLTDPQTVPGDSSDCSWTSDGTLLFVNNASGHYEAMARTPDGSYYEIAKMGGDVLSPVAVGGITVG